MVTPVTQPYLPPLNEFIPYLEKIWDNKWITNNGPFHQQLEAELCKYLDVKYISLFTNGTIALITALQALNITGEVITTPYSFVATSHSVIWNNLKPVFVDIDSKTFNLDPGKIEAAITSETTAIMPVHCYSNPCDVYAIQKIADKYGLRIIYDAAHAFGVNLDGKSLLCHGDMSVLSFHATKVFNTFEGGAIVCANLEMKQRIDNLKNFGFLDEITVASPGINGKMSEINSAFGLLQLKHLSTAISHRQAIDEYYRCQLKNVIGITIPELNINATSNYSYFPILVENNYPLSRDELYEKLKRHGILSRRYFYPLISNMPMYKNFPSADEKKLVIANNMSNKVLCIPIFSELDIDVQNKIINLIAN